MDGQMEDGGSNDAAGNEDGEAPVMETSESTFGIFAGFTAEFEPFENAMGFAHTEYLQWAGDHYNVLGAHWTRSNLQLMWDVIEPVLGAGYVWENEMGTETAFAAAAAAGVHYLAVFHEGGLIDSALRHQLDQQIAYEQFVETVVERYDGDGVDDSPNEITIKHWQVGNEVFLLEETPNSVPNYVDWFTLTAKAARRADPEAKMVLIASTESHLLIDFHSQVIESLASTGVRFDAVDIHHWGTAKQAEITAAEQYLALLESLQISDVELWSTEHGTYVGQVIPMEVTCDPPCTGNDVCVGGPQNAFCTAKCTGDNDCSSALPSCHLTSGRCTNPEQSATDQARSLVWRYVVNRDNGVRRIMWNNLVAWHQFQGQYGGFFDRTGLISGGFLEFESPEDCGDPRLSYFTYEMLAERTDTLHAERLGPVESGDPNTYVSAYRNRLSGVIGWVAWAWEAQDPPPTVELNVPTTEVSVVALITDASGIPVRDEVVAADGNTVTVELSPNPIWIEPQ
jgi:hypothetical protein